MTLRGSIPSELRRSWPAFALLTLFIALPGPRRSLFSGVPFSSKAHLAAAALLIIALMLILFPPRHRVRGRWMVALALLCAAKLMIAPMLRDEGWRGQYWTAQAFEKPSPHIAPLAPVRFFFRGTHGDRIDPVLTFNDVNFALFYVNDWPDLNSYRTEPAPRHIAQPLRIRWTGYIETPSPAPLSTTVTATGTTSIAIDGAEVFRATNPVQAPLSRGMTAGIHRIDIVYDKAPGETPAFTLAPLAFAVTPAPAGSAEMRRARLAAHAIDLLGLAALLLAAGALLDAYRPITNFLLVDIWDAPDKVLLIALTTLALLAGVNAAVGARGATIPMQRSDDPLAYEASARAVLFNGMAMKLQPGDTKPYFFYPGYSYALAAAHVVFGEDYGTI
ncbi:MAG: hypothetical protein QOE68_2529, partial [Thermoanaerobaculia bacterium]|nr:hypothetical protein [Thermoanaerobaculia bacterium]